MDHHPSWFPHQQLGVIMNQLIPVDENSCQKITFSTYSKVAYWLPTMSETRYQIRIFMNPLPLGFPETGER